MKVTLAIKSGGQLLAAYNIEPVGDRVELTDNNGAVTNLWNGDSAQVSVGITPHLKFSERLKLIFGAKLELDVIHA